ncbi:MAG: bifunctional riboflavin kinase/FAD synthetase [Lachnospiraceae bacterium]|nr:bifunctional riboflavin kinase/FAD synthetase [Lachnospiraceae bacterium]
MFYIHDTGKIRQDKPSIVTIGKFDGFHRGHQKILREAAAGKTGERQVVVFTFSRSPQMVLAGREGTSLNTRREKLALAERFGADGVVEYPFTEEVRRMSAETFLREILLDQLQACEIVAGPDCRFGYERQGDVAFLEEKARELGFSLHVVEKERYDDAVISSSRIREALARGEVEDAAAMLGYSFGYESEIVHGRRLGRTLGFPTINQEIPREKLVPALGVYAAEIFLEGQRFQGIANVGVRPTVSGGNGTAAAGMETSIFDFHEDVYGRRVRVNLRYFIRPEKRFPSLEALREQVERDKEIVREYWNRA